MSDPDIVQRIARLETRMDAASVALELATKELHRRLDDLNHAQARRDRAEATFMTRELHEAQIGARASKIQFTSIIASGVVAIFVTLLGLFGAYILGLG